MDKCFSIVEITSKNAQSRFKLGNNNELNGELDNITVLDIGRDHEYTESEILSKSTNSPFIGTRLYGMPVLTVYKGEIVYKR